MVSPAVSAISFLLSLAMAFLQDYLFSIPKGFSRRIFESAPKSSPQSGYYSSSNPDCREREKSLAGSASSDSHDSKKSRSFAIVPGAARGTFVYESSISSKSDIFSPLDQPPRAQRDPDSFSNLSFTIDHSPALASSSLETLQSTLSPPSTVLDVSDAGSPRQDNYLISLIDAHQASSSPIGIPLPPSMFSISSLLYLLVTNAPCLRRF